jgi:hypothetical protein
LSEAIEPHVPLPREIGSADLFSHRVAGVRSNVTSILRSEAKTGELRFEDEGIDLFAGGVWLASLWKSSQSILEIACSHGFGTWRVLMHPLDPNRPTRILAWPSADFEAEVRGMVATLRTGIPPSDRSVYLAPGPFPEQ